MNAKEEDMTDTSGAVMAKFFKSADGEKRSHR
jgi:hypothetical protein